MCKIHTARSAAVLSEFENATDEDTRFLNLPGACFAAYNIGSIVRAGELARACIDTAKVNGKSWNYGNAVHAGHTILGLIASTRGDVPAAIAELQASGAVPASPQLALFGPSMQLAKELLKIGETRAALSYILQCRNFWRYGQTWLELWKKKIARRSIPNFLMHIYR